MHNSSQQQGFALIEVLIAMFIAAGAMLSLGVFHLKSVQNSQLAMQRTVATIQVNDLIDRVWVNRCSNDYINQVFNDWDDHWSSSDVSHLQLDNDQVALQQLLSERESSIDIIDADLKEYAVSISWVNGKVGVADDDELQQTFYYYFKLPLCSTT